MAWGWRTGAGREAPRAEGALRTAGPALSGVLLQEGGDLKGDAVAHAAEHVHDLVFGALGLGGVREIAVEALRLAGPDRALLGSRVADGHDQVKGRFAELVRELGAALVLDADLAQGLQRPGVDKACGPRPGAEGLPAVAQARID